MTSNDLVFEPLRVTADAGKLAVEVSWRQAEVLQTFLRQKQLRAIICLDPLTREARLEMRPGVDANALRTAIREWSANPRGRL